MNDKDDRKEILQEELERIGLEIGAIHEQMSELEEKILELYKQESSLERELELLD